MNTKHIKNIFILAGMVNILGVLIFTRFFTNPVIPETDPVVMSVFGLALILVWGLAFITVSGAYEKVRWLVGVFVIEKLAYVIAWIRWIFQNDLSAVYGQDFMAGIFYTVYGPNDFLFMCFFTWVFLKTHPQ